MTTKLPLVLVQEASENAAQAAVTISFAEGCLSKARVISALTEGADTKSCVGGGKSGGEDAAVPGCDVLK